MRPDPAKLSDASKLVLEMDMNTLSRVIEGKYPHTWRRMNTKNIQSPHNFFGAKVLPIGLTTAIEESRLTLTSEGALHSNIGLVAGILERHNFPTYYVSSPLMEALKHSRPPVNLTWADLTLPFPGICFMIPRGSLIEPAPHSGEIMCCGVARFEANQSHDIPTLGRVMGRPDTHMNVFWFLAPAGLVMNDSSFPASHPLEPLAEWIDAKTVGSQYVGPDGKFSAYVAGLVANFILVMEARRELVEPGSRLHKPRPGRPEVWSPTFIGRNYNILRKDHQGAHDRKARFTELGWRAGHFKRQHFGPGREQAKTIFVDPYVAFTRGLENLTEEEL